MSQEQAPGWNRRQFLRGTGTLVGSLPLAQALSGCEPETSDPSPSRPETDASSAEVAAIAATPATTFSLSLVVNGVSKTVSVEARDTLNEVLRYKLGMTGTRLGCDRAACGACTVHLDGKAVYSCTTLAIEAAGRSVTTIEGLGTTSAIDPLQQAFIDQDALQCGYCTSGMIMSCKALLNANPAPTEQDVRVATAGNLCRCGTYPRVFKACQQAATAAKEG